MTLFIYGDSFSCQPAEYKHLSTNNHRWPFMVAKHLKHKEVNYGIGGSALEYSFDKMNKTNKEWSTGDTVILCETNLARRWFFSEFPHCGHINSIKKNKDIPNRDKNWADRWFVDFYSESLSFLQLQAYYHMLNTWCINRDIVCHILRCFDRPLLDNYSNVLFSEADTLNSISNSEFIESIYLVSNDTRIGHFTIENHVLIATAIIKAIINKTSINLDLPFKKKFL
jgi:hypothetical protein